MGKTSAPTGWCH